MLYRIGPAMLSLAVAWAAPQCTHTPDGDGDSDGDAGASVGGAAGASVGGVAGASVGGVAGTSVGGVAGASVGGAAGASVGGVAGTSVGGVAGATSGYAGSGGSLNVGGGAGLGAAEGGAAGMSSAGSAGMSGGAGGTSMGGSGAAGSGGGSATGHLVLSTPFVAFVAATCNGIANLPATFTLSNGSNAAINWSTTVTESSPFFSIAPTGSSLLPGETATVTVTPSALAPSSLPHNFPSNFSGTIAISGDPAGTQTVSVSEPVMGIDIGWTPASLDFGVVPIGTLPPQGNPSATLIVTESGPTNNALIELSSDNPNFFANVAPSFPQRSWSVVFAPTKTGFQTATLTWDAPQSNSAFCSAHSFTATGTGILVGAAGCVAAAATIDTPCGPNQVCGIGEQCVTELTLVGSPVTVSAGSFSGAVASGTIPLPHATLTANIDWGDQTVSDGSVVLLPVVGHSFPFTVSGSHTYASSGSFQGTVTVTDQTTLFSVQTAFTASN